MEKKDEEVRQGMLELQMIEERDCVQCKYCGVPKIEKPCQDCNNNHFYQFLGLEGDEDCFEEAKDINSKIIDS